MRQPPRQVVPPLCRQPCQWCRSHLKAIEPVGDDDPTLIFIGQNIARKIIGDGKVESVGPFRIFLPFPVAEKILPRGLHLDNRDFAARADGDDVDPASGPQGEFPQAGIAALDKHAGNGIGYPPGDGGVGIMHDVIGIQAGVRLSWSGALAPRRGNQIDRIGMLWGVHDVLCRAALDDDAILHNDHLIAD